VWHVGFSADGKTVATLGNRGICQLWDRTTGKEQGSFRLEGKNHANWLAYAPDGKYLAAWDGFGKLCLRDGATGAMRISLDVGGWAAGETDGAFSPDSKLLAVSRGQVIRFWNVPDGKPVDRFPHVVNRDQANYTSVNFSSEGKYLITGAFVSTP